MNSVSLSGLTPYLIIASEPDGTQVIDLTQTLLTMAKKLLDHETRITSLESQMSGKANVGHTHAV
jgi:hypothetical protein